MIPDFGGLPHQGAWLVYVNGLEIPCPSVSVSSGVWVIPEATLSFPPHRYLQRLGAEDRIDVVVFYLDDLADPENPTFKLLFEGDIIGWSYRDTPSGRMMSFNCICDIAVYQALYFFFMNNVDSAIGAGVTPGLNSNTVVQPGAYYPYSLFKKGLLATDKKPAADIDRPFEFLYNTVRGMTDIGLPDSRRALPSVNFFARWARKKNFVNRFAALPLFEDGADLTKGVFPIFKAVQDDTALDTMQQNLATTIGEAGSIFEVIQRTLGVVYFEMAMIPNAPCYRVRLEDGTILGTADTEPSSPDAFYTEPLRLMNYYVKPQFLFGIPPTCNVIFPCMKRSYTYQENYAAQPTRVYVNDTFHQTKLDQNALTSAALTFGFPPEINAVLRTRTGGTSQGVTIPSNPALNGKNVLVYPEEFFKGPVVGRLPVPSWFTLLQNRGGAAGPQSPDEYQKLQSLFELYSEYEYYRQRYEKRGGAVDLVWNPYVLPGYPCVIFDKRTSAMDVIGYVMNVSHSMSSASGGGSMQTNISYGFGRTLNEMLDLLKSDMTKLGVVLGCAPAEPVDQVRAIIQDFGPAEEFYNALLFGRAVTPNKKASFDFRDVVGYVKGTPEDLDQAVVEPIVVDGSAKPGDVTFVGSSTVDDTNQSVPSQGVAVTLPSNTIDSTRDLQPLEAFKDIFQNYDAAMKYVARPICTLLEYLAFIHGGDSVETLTAAGQVVGPQTKYGYSKSGTPVSAIYYDRIKKFRQGPGTPPTPPMVGATVTGPVTGGTTNQATPYSGTPVGVPDDFPQTRADWDSLLEAYRKEMYTQQAPQR